MVLIEWCWLRKILHSQEVRHTIETPDHFTESRSSAIHVEVSPLVTPSKSDPNLFLNDLSSALVGIRQPLRQTVPNKTSQNRSHLVFYVLEVFPKLTDSIRQHRLYDPLRAHLGILIPIRQIVQNPMGIDQEHSDPSEPHGDRLL